jgi:hypothetical protein
LLIMTSSHTHFPTMSRKKLWDYSTLVSYYKKKVKVLNRAHEYF